jgi:hypothetical protein
MRHCKHVYRDEEKARTAGWFAMAAVEELHQSYTKEELDMASH